MADRVAPLVAVLTLAALPVFAQATPEPDAEGCKDSPLLSRIAGCWITECESRDFDEGEFPTTQAEAEGESPQKVEGVKERVVYLCTEKVSVLQIHRNVENAVKTAGWTVRYAGGSDARVVTAQKAGTWVTVRSEPWNEQSMYTVLTVRTQEMAQQMEAGNADAWAAEITKTGRVAVYGINFDTGKAAVTADSEPVLSEIVKLLQAQPTLKLRIEGHTDNVGARAANQKLSGDRAAAVMAWLVGRGIDKARLASVGLGDTKPVGDNATDPGRAKNRRVELVKM